MVLEFVPTMAIETQAANDLTDLNIQYDYREATGIDNADEEITNEANKEVLCGLTQEYLGKFIERYPNSIASIYESYFSLLRFCVTSDTQARTKATVIIICHL